MGARTDLLSRLPVLVVAQCLVVATGSDRGAGRSFGTDPLVGGAALVAGVALWVVVDRDVEGASGAGG